MGDFSGDPTQPLRPLADRKFIQIDRDNFNDVMARMNPGLKLKVDNKLSEDGGQMAVDLKFNSIEDFEPARVAQQVPALRALMETRAKLRDLMSKVDRSEELEGLLEQVLKNEDELKSLSSQLRPRQEGGLIDVRRTDRSTDRPATETTEGRILPRSGRRRHQADRTRSGAGPGEEPGRAGARRAPSRSTRT